MKVSKKQKEAVALDVQDGISWYILGNAYLANFFLNSSNPVDTMQALKAYQQAESCTNSVNNPDLHFNRAVIYKFQEEYQKSVEGFSKASLLDATWEEPKKEIKQITDFVERVMDHISKKGRIKETKPKRLQQLVKGIPNDVTNQNRAVVLLTELNVGLNTGKAIIGKVVSIISTKGYVPMTLILVDKEGNLIPASIYNISEAGVKVTDTLRITDPFLKTITFNVSEKMQSYLCIQADYPKLLINDKKPNQASFAQTTLVLENPDKNEK